MVTGVLPDTGMADTMVTTTVTVMDIARATGQVIMPVKGTVRADPRPIIRKIRPPIMCIRTVPRV